MALRARKPESIEKKLKMLLFGSWKVGKTMAALNFPSVYAIDCEKGMVHDQYVRLLQENHSEILQTSDVDEVIEEVRALGTDTHHFQTVLIDPITLIESDLMEKGEAELRKTTKDYKEGDIRVYGIRDRKLKRLINLLNRLDMNVIVTAHGKINYAPGGTMQVIGTTFDGWKRWPFEFDLIIELERRGDQRVAIVRGSRLVTFTELETFQWSYEEFLRRYPIIDKPVTPVVLASAEQVAELKELLDVVKVPEDTLDKWLLKAKVDCLEDMSADTITKCIEFTRAKLPKEATSEV